MGIVSWPFLLEKQRKWEISLTRFIKGTAILFQEMSRAEVPLCVEKTGDLWYDLVFSVRKNPKKPGGFLAGNSMGIASPWDAILLAISNYIFRNWRRRKWACVDDSTRPFLLLQHGRILQTVCMKRQDLHIAKSACVTKVGCGIL